MKFVDSYFYSPSFFQKVLSFSLLPLSLLFCLVTIIKRTRRVKNLEIPIISIGNLTVGGSGKTPLLIKIASSFDGVFVVSRGYGRKSSEILVVSLHGEILESVERAGDEAMLIAKELPNASVIVAQKREEGIEKAKKLGAKVLFLDDGFRDRIKKFDIILKPKVEPYFRFCLPSGAYKEPKSLEKKSDISLKEGIDYKRVVKIKNPTKKMALLTAIANPMRLDEFLPKSVVAKKYFRDHYYFGFDEVKEFLDSSDATSLLVTKKDLVKLENFNLPLSILELDIEIDLGLIEKIEKYIKG